MPHGPESVQGASSSAGSGCEKRVILRPMSVLQERFRGGGAFFRKPNVFVQHPAETLPPSLKFESANLAWYYPLPFFRFPIACAEHLPPSISPCHDRFPRIVSTPPTPTHSIQRPPSPATVFVGAVFASLGGICLQDQAHLPVFFFFSFPNSSTPLLYALPPRMRMRTHTHTHVRA